MFCINGISGVQTFVGGLIVPCEERIIRWQAAFISVIVRLLDECPSIIEYDWETLLGNAKPLEPIGYPLASYWA